LLLVRAQRLTKLFVLTFKVSDIIQMNVCTYTVILDNEMESVIDQCMFVKPNNTL